MQTSKTIKALRYAVAMLTVCQASLTTATAQSEAGLLTELSAEKSITKKISVTVEGDYRTRNNFKTTDRWSLGVAGEYKLMKGLKLSAGYKMLQTNFRENITLNTNGTYNNWRPSYWGTRHRLHATLSGSYKLRNNLKISLRERWQWTYRAEKSTDRWDFDNALWETTLRSGKAHHQLRSRLELSYDKKHSLLTPYASIELYNGWNIEKIRYTVGTDLNLSKQHTLSVFYRFQDIKDNSADTYDPDMHYMGIGYKFKF